LDSVGDYYSFWGARISFFYPSSEVWYAMLMALFCLAAIWFISASEIAFFSLTPQDVKSVNGNDLSRDKAVKRLLQMPNRLLATILVFSSFLNVTLVVLSNFIVSGIVDFHGFGWFELLLKIVIFTFLLLLFGEIMPKLYAAGNPLLVARKTSFVIAFLEKVLSPFSYFLAATSGLLNRLIIRKSRQISMDELSHALELTSDEIKDEKEILQGIIRFGDKIVADVMKPRVDIVCMDIRLTYKDALARIVESGYSRIPVYAGTQDTIKGILYGKDLLPYLNKPENFRWQSLIRPAYFVPETKKIDDLLEEFKTNKIHIAIVVDEYGGTSGLVTMEDVLEEIVGEISDEYDTDERLYVVLADNSIVFEAKILLNDFYKVIGVEESEFADVAGEADTLAGLILEMKGDFPARREVITHGRYSFQILEMDKRRIQKIKYVLLPE